MKVLLQLMLIHYFTDGKRNTSARFTRKVDREIRELCNNDAGLATIVDNCKKVAESNKRHERDNARALRRSQPWKHPPGVEYVPCKRAK